MNPAEDHKKALIMAGGCVESYHYCFRDQGNKKDIGL
jgi:hypothetical protein